MTNNRSITDSKTIFHIDHSVISQIIFNKENNICTVLNKHNEVICEFSTEYSIYNDQYNIVIFSYVDIVIIGSWEKGLLCYNYMNGTVRWQIKNIKPRHIYSHANKVIAEVFNKGIYIINGINGQIIENLPMRDLEFLFKLNDSHFIFGYKNGNIIVYNLINESIIKRFSKENININRCLSFVIVDCIYKDNLLTFSGFEEFPNQNPKRNGVNQFSRDFRLDLHI